jgi:L-lactate utilization protein LutB
MGYRSSPTCSHCWKCGHTKRGCPVYRGKAEKWLAENPNVTRSFDKPYFVREVEGYKNIAKNRKCSWCSEQGHTKRTCPKRKEATAKNISKNKEWRAEVLEKLKEMGIGEGTLIADTRRDNSLYLVINMQWNKLNLTGSSEEFAPSADYSKYDYRDGQTYPEFTLCRVKDGHKLSTYFPMLKDKLGRDLLYYGTNNLKVVSSSEPRPPDNWLNDESWAKKLF